MAWVYISIALGSAGFLLYVVIEYLKSASTLKPQADYARQQIREVEMTIETESATVEASKEEMSELQNELKVMEEELKTVEKESAKLKSRESRRRPTSHRVDE